MFVGAVLSATHLVTIRLPPWLLAACYALRHGQHSLDLVCRLRYSCVTYRRASSNATNAAGRTGSMQKRLVYAVNKTIKSLHAVLKTETGYEIPLAFMLTLAGFGALQFAINHDVNNVFAHIIVGCAIGTVLFLSAIGFITFICVVFVFAYAFTISSERGFNSPRLRGWNRSWRIVLSFSVSGAVTAAVFNPFYEGLPLLGTQYPFLLA